MKPNDIHRSFLNLKPQLAILAHPVPTHPPKSVHTPKTEKKKKKRATRVCLKRKGLPEYVSIQGKRMKEV